MTRGVITACRCWALSHAAAIVLLAACGSESGGVPSAEEIAQGQRLFRGTCATCHGYDAQGMPMLGKDLRHNEFVAGLDDAELVEFLREGRPANHPLNERRVEMPPRGGNPALEDEDLRLIGLYMRSVQ